MSTVQRDEILYRPKLIDRIRVSLSLKETRKVQPRMNFKNHEQHNLTRTQ